MTSGSENRRRSVMVAVRVTPTERELLKGLADYNGCSIAELMRRALLSPHQPKEK